VGLEGVYIIVETEDLFGIEITNDEARFCRTPDDLIGLVEAKIATSTPDQCLSQKAFYGIRRGLRELVPALTTDPRLDTSLTDVTSKERWPDLWERLRRLVGTEDWPEVVPWPRRWFNLGDEPKTVRDLVMYIVTSLPTPNASKGENWTRQRIEMAIRRIVSEELGQSRAFDTKASFVSLGVR
jgi:hypothetical protein